MRGSSFENHRYRPSLSLNQNDQICQTGLVQRHHPYSPNLVEGKFCELCIQPPAYRSLPGGSESRHKGASTPESESSRRGLNKRLSARLASLRRRWRACGCHQHATVVHLLHQQYFGSATSLRILHRVPPPAVRPTVYLTVYDSLSLWYCPKGMCRNRIEIGISRIHG